MRVPLHANPRPKKTCCCCARVRTGIMLIGILEVVFGVYSLAFPVAYDNRISDLIPVISVGMGLVGVLSAYFYSFYALLLFILYLFGVAISHLVVSVMIALDFETEVSSFCVGLHGDELENCELSFYIGFGIDAGYGVVCRIYFLLICWLFYCQIKNPSRIPKASDAGQFSPNGYGSRAVPQMAGTQFRRLPDAQNHNYLAGPASQKSHHNPFSDPAGFTEMRPEPTYAVVEVEFSGQAPTGITFNDTGLVTWVDADSQGHIKGIRPDWFIKTINGIPAKKSRKRMMEQIARVKKQKPTYVIGFIERGPNFDWKY